MKNYIVKSESAQFFECGYSCDNAILANFCGEKFFFTDGRYESEARSQIKNANVILSKDLIKDLRLLIRRKKIKNLCFDPLEFSIYEYEKLSFFLDTNLVKIPQISKKNRIIKSDFEIEILKNAAKIGKEKFDEFAIFLKNFGENLSEEELFFNAEIIFKDKGNCDLSFSPIIAINENSAKAHALPTKKKLKSGDLILLDAGVKFKNFCSDRTRCAEFNSNLSFSKDQKFTNSKRQEIYEIVKEAQNLAISKVKPGILAYEIDLAARNFITKCGFKEKFLHSTGHGVGLDIHELPIIAPNSKQIIKEGMVFSIEPGIYLENEFGIRIEDVVLVTEMGCEIL